MIYVALALAGGWLASLVAALSLLRAQWRAHARREDLILNQLLHATGKTWQPAPADLPKEQEPERSPYSAVPEQDLVPYQ